MSCHDYYSRRATMGKVGLQSALNFPADRLDDQILGTLCEFMVLNNHVYRLWWLDRTDSSSGLGSSVYVRVTRGYEPFLTLPTAIILKIRQLSH